MNFRIEHAPREVRARDLAHLQRLSAAVGAVVFTMAVAFTLPATSGATAAAKVVAAGVVAGLAASSWWRGRQRPQGRVDVNDFGVTIDDQFLFKKPVHLDARVVGVHVGHPPTWNVRGVRPHRLNPRGLTPNVTVTLDRPVRLTSLRGRPVLAGHAPLSSHRESNVIQARVADDEAAAVRREAAARGWLPAGGGSAEPVGRPHSRRLRGHRVALIARVTAVVAVAGLALAAARPVVRRLDRHAADVAPICSHPEAVRSAGAVEFADGDLRPQLPGLLGVDAGLVTREQALQAAERDVPLPGDVPLSGLAGVAERVWPSQTRALVFGFETSASAHAAATDLVRMRCSVQPKALKVPVAGAVGLEDVWHGWGDSGHLTEFQSESAVLWRGRVVEFWVGTDIADAMRDVDAAD